MKEVQAQLDQNLLGQLCHGSPGLDSGLFSAAARPGQRPFSYWAQTWHSKIGIRDENRK